MTQGTSRDPPGPRHGCCSLASDFDAAASRGPSVQRGRLHRGHDQLGADRRLSCHHQRRSLSTPGRHHPPGRSARSRRRADSRRSRVWPPSSPGPWSPLARPARAGFPSARAALCRAASRRRLLRGGHRVAVVALISVDDFEGGRTGDRPGPESRAQETGSLIASGTANHWPGTPPLPPRRPRRGRSPTASRPSRNLPGRMGHVCRLGSPPSWPAPTWTEATSTPPSEPSGLGEGLPHDRPEAALTQAARGRLALMRQRPGLPLDHLREAGAPRRAIRNDPADHAGLAELGSAPQPPPSTKRADAQRVGHDRARPSPSDRSRPPPWRWAFGVPRHRAGWQGGIGTSSTKLSKS